MKPITALLAASLVANLALVAAYLTATPSKNRGAQASAANRPGAASPARTASTDIDGLRRALDAGDAAAMQAAGVSAETARDIELGRAFSRIADKLRAARNASADNRWWRQRDSAPGSREQLAQIRREISDALFAAFGEDFSSLTPNAGSLAYLSPEKREALRRILQDYDEMMAKFGAGGIQLASDREKLRLLRAERDRDIAGLLTPEERLAYEMRTSPSAATVRSRYGDGIETEEDFRKIYALQKAFDDKFPLESLTGKVTPEVMQQRLEAQRQLQDDIRAALGDEKFAALRRASDSDLRNVESLVTRLNLPPATTDQIAAARETFASESQRVAADTTLNPPQRRSQIQEIGNKAKAELTRTLGAEAADAYAQRSPWVSMLQGGVAFSTTPPAGSPAAMMPVGQSVYPVMAAGPSTPGATRQVIVTGGQTSDQPAAHGDLFFAPIGGGPRDNVHVMTFSTSSSTDSPPPQTVEKRVVAPTPAPKP